MEQTKNGKDMLPVIDGEKIRLRPITDLDTALIVKWRNNPEVRRFFIFQERFTSEMHRQWLKTKVNTGEVIQYIIEEQKTNCAIGSVYFRDINQNFSSAEYGVFIGEDSARSHGYGTEATKLFIDFGLNSLALHRISLRAFKENQKAIHSYKKAGFVKEGVFRDMVKLDGEYHDIVFMAIVKNGK
jgi:UDP-4-amino-4,6-dideoxy-N-acetyl-beta-L-altrosamine N-acetyltransferase